MRNLTRPVQRLADMVHGSVLHLGVKCLKLFDSRGQDVEVSFDGDACQQMLIGGEVFADSGMGAKAEAAAVRAENAITTLNIYEDKASAAAAASEASAEKAHRWAESTDPPQEGDADSRSARSWASTAADYVAAASGCVEAAADSSESAAAKASEAANSALAAARSRGEAERLVEQYTGLKADAVTLAPGSSATALYDPSTETLSLGLPRGETGASVVDATLSASGDLLLTAADGTTSDAGRVRPVFRGSYDPSTAYILYDSVLYEGSSYVCTSSSGSPAGTPPTDDAWEMLAFGGTGLPLGAIYAYTGKDVPAGGLRLNGQTLTNCDTMFPEFYAWVLANGIRGTLAEYTAALTAYDDQCGFFGVDETAKTVRLPRISQFLAGSVDVAEFGQAQLDQGRNITGTAQTFVGYVGEVTNGAFRSVTGGSTFDVSALAGSNLGQGSSNMDASRVWGASHIGSRFRPANVRYPYIIHVYNAAVSASVTQAAAFTNAVDGLRTDVPGLAAHASMPSRRYLDLTFAYGNSYTAPSDGWFIFSRYAGATIVYLRLIDDVSKLESIILAGDANETLLVCLPTSKGNAVLLGGNASGNILKARFIYAEGAE